MGSALIPSQVGKNAVLGLVPKAWPQITNWPHITDVTHLADFRR